MALSSVVIAFNSVPNINEVLNIAETSLSLNLNEIFKDLRYGSGQVEIPNFESSDGRHPDRYFGYISNFYRTAFNADYNTGGYFTVTAASGATNSGIGTVTITANYTGAVFVLGTSTADVTVTIYNQAPITPPPGTISFSPNLLLFEHSQNDVLPSFGVAFSGDLWKILGKPHFILSCEGEGTTTWNVGTGDGVYQRIQGSGDAIVTIGLTSHFDADITFTGDDAAGSFNVYKNNVFEDTIDYFITVNKLSDFLAIPYAVGEKAFTLDTKYFEFESEATNTYFQFDALIKTYDFFTNTLNEITVNQKVVLFNGYQKIMLGQLIHRLMRRFLEPNDNEFQYKEATLKITCAEKLLANNSTIRSGISKEIPFIAGLSKGITNLGFLDFNHSPNRVTKNSFAYLNMLYPAGDYKLELYNNNVLVYTDYLPESDNKIVTKKVDFINFEQGDIVYYKILPVSDEDPNVPVKIFKLFPKGNFSNHIVWENEFLVQSAIECTGNASIVPDGEFQSQLIYEDLVEKLVNLSSSKNVKLNINTGYLLKSDIDTIESLMRSKRAWLVQGESFINLVPTAKKLPPRDLQTELIQFELEFKINQNYNEETYSL